MPSHYEGSEKEVRALDAYIKLMRVSDTITARLTELKTLNDLSLSQFGAMEALYHLGTMCQKDIGEKILKSSGNITMVIDNLEKKGYVARERDESDRRFLRVSLTETGRKKIEEILPTHVGAIVEMMDTLTPEEQEKLGRLAKKLGKNIRDL